MSPPRRDKARDQASFIGAKQRKQQGHSSTPTKAEQELNRDFVRRLKARTLHRLKASEKLVKDIQKLQLTLARRDRGAS